MSSKSTASDIYNNMPVPFGLCATSLKSISWTMGFAFDPGLVGFAVGSRATVFEQSVDLLLCLG